MEITVVKGDITEQDVDVIVNAANPGLLGGGRWMALSIKRRVRIY